MDTMASKIAAAEAWDFCTLFAVFCTTDIPPANLDSLLESVSKEHPRDMGSALSVITSRKVSKNLRISEPPCTDFETPFAGKSMAELRSLYEAEFSQWPWGEHCFIVLDARFIADGTVVLVSADPDWEGQYEDEEELEELKEDTMTLNYRCDAAICLDLLVSYAHNHDNGFQWHEEDDEEAWNWVYTAEAYKRQLSGR